MAYYESFMTYTKLPIESWRSQAQAFLDENFINSSDVIMIEEEADFGSLEFTPILARVTSCLDSKVGDKHNDDYKTLFFNDIDYKPPLGKRFRFDNNIWIVYNSENINSLNSSCYVRRCNNTINSLDYYGRLHREPCVLDIKPTKSSFVEDESMWTISTRQVLYYQKNKWTENIGFNSRIMFERQSYRVGVNLNFNRTETFEDESVNMIQAYLDLDLVNEYDNQELQIADFYMPKFKILTPSTLFCKIGSVGNISYSVKREEVDKAESVIFSSLDSDIVSIDENTGEYECVGEGNTKITVKLKENPIYFSEIDITVSSSSQNVYETKLSPSELYIPLNGKKTYTATEYLDGVPISTGFSFSVVDIPSKYYSMTISGNSCTIENKMESDSILLHLIVQNERSLEEEDYYIELGGLF